MKPIVSLLRLAYRGLWWTVVSIVVMFGVVVAVARLGLPVVSEYRDQVQAWLDQEFGVTVTIGAVEASWHGLYPKLLVREATLLDPEGRPSAVRVAQAQVSLDLWASLRTLRPQPAEVELRGIALQLLRRRDGRVTVRGWPTGGPTDWRAISDWILQHHKIHLLDTRLTIEDEASGLVFDLRDANLYLLKVGDGHRMTASATLYQTPVSIAALAAGRPGAGNSHRVAGLKVAVDLTGGATGQGRYYLSVEDLDLRLPLEHGVPPLEVTAMQIWADRLDDAWDQIDAEIGALRVGNDVTGPVLRLRPSGWSARRAIGGWRLHAQPLQPERRSPVQFTRHDPVPDGGSGLWLDWSIDSDVDSETTHAVDIRVDQVRAEALTGLLRNNPRVTPALREQLVGLAPRGGLRGLTLRKQPGSSGIVLGTGFSGLISNAWHGIPGLDELSGGLSIEVGQRGGRVTLGADAGVLNFGGMFQAPWPIDKLRADLVFESDDDGWQLTVRRMLLENPDLALDARGTFSAPAADLPDHTGPELDLVIAIERGRAERIYPYLPVKYMSQGSRDWLGRALVGGTVTGGSAVFRGPTRKFPFAHGEGVFEVSFDVDDAIIDYAENWPRLEEVDAEVVFRGQDMFIHAVGGQIFDARMTRVDVHLPDLQFPGEDGRVLTIDGDLDLPVDEVRHFILNSPLTERFGPLVESLRTTGEGSLHIKLVLPLKDTSQAEVSGTLAMKGADLHWQRSGLQLKQVYGRLDFDGSGLRGKDIRARLLGLPTRVTVRPATERGEKVTHIVLAGALDAKFIERTLGRAWSERFNGRSRWKATITSPQNPQGPVEARAVFESDLVGLGIDLPVPATKAAADKVDFRIGTTLGDGPRRRLWFDYGQRLGGVLELDRVDNTLLRGQLRVGGGEAKLPAGRELRVDGALDRLSVDDWVTALKSTFGGAAPDSDKTGRASTEWLQRLHAVNLRVGRLELFHQRYSDLSFRLRRRARNWLVDVDGDEIKGRITIPTTTVSGTADAVVRLDMQRLYAVSPGDDDDGVGEPPDPRELPELRVAIEDFRFDGLALGRLIFSATKTPFGLVVKPFKLESPLLKVDAQGRWLMEKGRHYSHFNIAFNGPDLGGMLDQLGFADTIKGGETQGVIDADWNGAPSQFSLAALNGSFDINIGSGSLLWLDPGAGRLFALLSPQVLTRSLADSDTELTGEGFYFEKIEGRYELRNGNAYTDRLSVEGPVARIDISGRIGLLAEDYNQYVQVTPRTSGGMTVATGAVALANPPLGAAMLLAQAVFGDVIDKLGNRYYLISGKWDDPQVTRLSRPRGGKK